MQENQTFKHEMERLDVMICERQAKLDEYLTRKGLKMYYVKKDVQKQLDEYMVIDTCSSDELHREWYLYGDSELYIYEIQKGTTFTLNSNDKTTTDREKYITINTWDDMVFLADTFAYYTDNWGREYLGKCSVDRITGRFGSRIENDALGFEKLDEAASLRHDGNFSKFLGRKEDTYYLFIFATS
ncbi:hypothetical protein QTN25_000612 [Entamoeba marina]